MVDAIELKRAKPPEVAVPRELPDAGPSELPPASTESFEIRERWSLRFVPWFLATTGGDLHPDGGPEGHRWRIEYFDCVRDPKAFAKRAEQETQAYLKKESDRVEGK